MLERVCYKCKRKLPLNSEYFHVNKSKKGGFNYSCKECSVKQTQISKNKEKARLNQRIARKERLENGFCAFCYEKRLENSSYYCEKHFLQDKSKQHLKTTKYDKELKAILEKQNYKCVYTGEQLVLGLNASVDHIKPQFTNPELYDNINNLQWVTNEVNIMKRNLSEERFLKIITKIYDNKIRKE